MRDGGIELLFIVFFIGAIAVWIVSRIKRRDEEAPAYEARRFNEIRVEAMRQLMVEQLKERYRGKVDQLATATMSADDLDKALEELGRKGGVIKDR